MQNYKIIVVLLLTPLRLFAATGGLVTTSGNFDAALLTNLNIPSSIARTNYPGFQPTSANLTDWSMVSPSQYTQTSSFGSAAFAPQSMFQTGNQNLTNWGNAPTNLYPLAASLGTASTHAATDFYSSSNPNNYVDATVTNGLSTKTYVDTTFQPASANLTNWSAAPTNLYALTATLGTAAFQPTTAFYPASGNPSGFVTASVTNGLATTSYVASVAYPLNGNPSNYLTVANLSGMTFTNPVVSGTMTLGGNLVIGASTNTATFTLVYTNWVDGFTYTNNTGRPVFVFQPCVCTPSLLLGNSTYALRVNGTAKCTANQPSVLTALIPAATNFVCYTVLPSATFAFTNVSSAGAAVGFAGGYYEVH